ncbi:GyrI-like domain-containing protein [Terrimonas sp.]|uniref:GyrI-like domain-containing protein n=1 Tax=Terrimonas sp. TaxID=1914338 RepID=UPI000D50C5C7|nr:GyrI-like domain-containing protein [Terrimonas sp.]PVD52263.1 GyrI-like domain-containing protein [Terrimonas sp.]
MIPTFKISGEKKLIGMPLIVSFSNYRVNELWKSFMPRRKEIINRLTDELISMSVYKQTHFEHFAPTNTFEKWAAIEVANFDNVPDEMQTFMLPGGLYAVFNYQGLNTDNAVYEYIFGNWLPDSGYVLDNRPHFEVLGAKYKNNDPTSEEEIWIPVKPKNASD